jgi:hypothetical protein
VSPGYAAAVARATASRRDVWGEELLSAPGGPTYEAARRFLSPVLYGQQRQHRPLTPSGVYYLAFAYPLSAQSRPVYALHVADGSQIITRRIGPWSPSVTIKVGPHGRERYGACLAWLTPAALAEGYLPILRTSYVDANGVRYRQESFLGRVKGFRPLVSLVRLSVDARPSRAAAVVRFLPSQKALVRRGDRLDTTAGTALIASDGAAYDGRAFRFRVAPGDRKTVYLTWVLGPTAIPKVKADQKTYEAMRASVVSFWHERLAMGAQYSVPEDRVQDAERAMTIQQIGHSWRYSVGNPYEELSYVEGTDAAEVMSRYGYPDVARDVLDFSLLRLPRRFTSWRAGERLVAEAVYYQLYRDRAVVDADTPELLKALSHLEDHQLKSGSNAGRLEPERLCSDEPEPVDSVTAQAVVWQGLLAMARVWSATGHPDPAARARMMAFRLEAALRPVVQRRLTRLSDGTLFLPESLTDCAAPYDNLSSTREGSYWNLVVPYTFASGFFRPGSSEARGLIGYLLAHGSRMLGVPRADAHVVYIDPIEGKTSGFGQIYGFATSRFLADNDRPDQLVLTLYGMLGAAMTPNTFVSGEAVSVVPIGDTYFRKTYMPPNSGTNSTFLETLRLILLQETRGPQGAPRGLDLAFSTPRGWLRSGKAIRVGRAPTSFGPLSYSIVRRGRSIRVHVVPPPRPVPQLRLRLRLPAGERLGTVRVGGRRIRFDRASGTIGLTGHRMPVDLVATVIERAGS